MKNELDIRLDNLISLAKFISMLLVLATAFALGRINGAENMQGCDCKNIKALPTHEGSIGNSPVKKYECND